MISTVELNDLGLAQAGNQGAFERLTEPHRRSLLSHCYRMLGSLQDAEDLVQETLLRAWRKLGTFERHVSFRAWLYKIATNACLDTLDKVRGRTLPTMAYPAADPGETFGAPVREAVWLEPFPDELLDDVETGPEARYTLRESITLAFLVALQTLPPRQRAVLLMRDVLDFSANEAAEILEMTLSSVNSVLHRARVTLAKQYDSRERDSMRAQPANEKIRELLERYVRAWEKSDIGMLVKLLKDDATLTMPPTPSWFRGREAVRMFIEIYPFSAEAGRWRLEGMRVNGQPGFRMFRRDVVLGEYQAVGTQVLSIVDGEISGIVVFLNDEFFVG